MNEPIHPLKAEAIGLLRELVAIPSFSKEEWQTAEVISHFLSRKGIPHQRAGNNVYARNMHFDPVKPTLLLNSHHDTVQPNTGYTRNPFEAVIEGNKLYGLGSNDAGGCLVSILAAFVHFFKSENLRYNLLFAGTAEEEISGKGGFESLLPLLPPIDCAIVGEPTSLQMAVAEKGLLVLDCTVKGRAGHAAREEGDNAIYKAIQDIKWIQTYGFDKISPLLGPVKMSVTVIETPNRTHNTIPDTCHYVMDIRVNECYTLEEILAIVQQHIHADAHPRSLRLRSSYIQPEHPLVQSGILLGSKTFGSPTTSDKALMPFPALKIGPGDSARSHTADEFIYVKEIEEGIDLYIQLLKGVL